jgi:Flp pilus assembly protein TadG
VIRHYFRQLRKNERGATMVEFALVALLLFTLIFGIIEFGWVFFGWITLTAAVREGARLAVVGEEFGVIEETVTKHAVAMNGLKVKMTPRYTHGTYTSVSAEGELPLAIGFFFSGNSVTLSAEATMRQE